MEDDPAHGRVLEGKLVERTITDVVINVPRPASVFPRLSKTTPPARR